MVPPIELQRVFWEHRRVVAGPLFADGGRLVELKIRCLDATGTKFADCRGKLCKSAEAAIRVRRRRGHVHAQDAVN